MRTSLSCERVRDRSVSSIEEREACDEHDCGRIILTMRAAHWPYLDGWLAAEQ
jgi:hypothetical protein